MKSILDPSFHYTPSDETDLRKTFARVRSEGPPTQAEPRPMNRRRSAIGTRVSGAYPVDAGSVARVVEDGSEYGHHGCWRIDDPNGVAPVLQDDA